jgi:nitroreductase
MHDILHKLHWRYATKEFDPEKKLTEDEVHTILESGRLAPSSYGLQPWKFIVVENPEIRAKLRDAAYGQAQITDASELVVLCRLSCIGSDHVSKYVESTAKIQEVPIENLDGYKQMMIGALEGKSTEELENWMARQVYIALGFMLHTAALMEIDTCPMEGFDPKKFDEILGLEALGVSAVVLCTLGHRKGSDETSAKTKSRFEKEEVVHVVR